MGELPLPVVIKMIDAAKTSLLEEEPRKDSKDKNVSIWDAGTKDKSLHLRSQYLDRITAGEPQQRLLIVYDEEDPESLESLLDLLRNQIDLPARQVLIEAMVVEVNDTDVLNLGVSYSGSKDDVSGSFNSGSAHPSSESEDSLPLNFVFDSTADVADFFQARISALVEDGQAEILSKPSVLVLDGRQASIQVAHQVPVVTKLHESVIGITSAIEYHTAGIVLNLRPRVNESGSHITMQVESIIGEVVGHEKTEIVVLITPHVVDATEDDSRFVNPKESEHLKTPDNRFFQDR